LAASISVEAVTPPLVGWTFKELLLFCGVSAGKSTADGTICGYWFWAVSAAFSLSALEALQLVDRDSGRDELAAIS
jgi:hypothetical protein